MSLQTPSLAHPLFPNHPFQPLHNQIPDEPSSAPSSYNATLIYSSMTSDPPDHSSPVNTELKNELDNFITLQQQLQHPNTLTFHHLSQTMTSSVSSNPHPLLEKPEPTEYLNGNSPIPHSLLTLDQLKHFRIIHFILAQKIFSKCACHSFHNILTITQILTTTNLITLTKMPSSAHFHGPHINISKTRHQFHYIIIQTTLNCVKLDYII